MLFGLALGILKGTKILIASISSIKAASWMGVLDKLFWEVLLGLSTKGANIFTIFVCPSLTAWWIGVNPEGPPSVFKAIGHFTKGAIISTISVSPYSTAYWIGVHPLANGAFKSSVIIRDRGTGVAGVALATPRFLNLLYKFFWKLTFPKSVFTTGYP